MFYEKSCLVVGPGRTGTTRLTKFIALKYYTSLELKVDNQIKQLILGNQKFITWTYEILQRSSFPNITTIYNVRENVIDSILSRYINDKFQLWLPGQTPKPFVADIAELEEIIFFQMTWYNNYRPMLTTNSHVVVYEIFQSLCPFVYENELDKKFIIKNYDDIIKKIKNKFTNEFLNNHAEFLDYRQRVNCQEIYHWLQKST